MFPEDYQKEKEGTNLKPWMILNRFDMNNLAQPPALQKEKDKAPKSTGKHFAKARDFIRDFNIWVGYP